MNLGFTRVLTDDQIKTTQLDALRAVVCGRVFEERASGGRWDRPVLHRMLDQLRQGDVVIVWKFDRLSRSLKELLPIMESIYSAGAGFRSLTEAIDTTTPAGRMMMQMVGVFAEFERAMIRAHACRFGARTEEGTPARTQTEATGQGLMRHVSMCRFSPCSASSPTSALPGYRTGFPQRWLYRTCCSGRPRLRSSAAT